MPTLSWRCPGSRTKRTRLPSASTRATILVVSPPRDRPMACVRVPPRAPVPCWCTRTIVPSTITYSKSASADTASKILPKTPPRLHRRNLRKTEFHFPKDSGRSRHGAPTRTIQRPASRKSRLSAADLPGSPALPGTCGAIRSHWSSRRTIRSKGNLLVGSLEPNVSSTGNSPIDFECQQALVRNLEAGNQPGRGLRHQPDQLIHGQRQNAEHQMAHHLRRAANPHCPGPEVILQPSVGPLSGGAFGVADRLGEAEPEPLAQGLLGCAFLLAAGIAADVEV